MECQNKKFVISMEESERIQIIKIWFIIMVIFIHSYTEEVHFNGRSLVLQVPMWLEWIKYIISQIISRCAVPGYFFISAVLLYKRNFIWIDNIKKKFRTLIIPYFIFNTLWISIFFIAQQMSALSIYFSREDIIISDWGILQFANAYLGFTDGHPILYPLWFVRDLIILNILAIFIKQLIDKAPIITMCALLLMGGGILKFQMPLFFISQTAIVYFCFGYYFVKYNVKFNDSEKIKAPIIAVLYIICIIVNCYTKTMEIHNLIQFLTIIIGLVFFYRFTTKIENVKWHGILIYIAKYTFPIYLFHEMNLTILKKILTKLLPSTAVWQILLYFGIPIIVFALCLGLSIFLDKYVHKLYLILVGNRMK